MKKLFKYILLSILILSMNGCLSLGVGFDIPIAKKEDNSAVDSNRRVLISSVSKATLSVQEKIK